MTSIAGEVCVFCFETAGIMARTALFVGNAALLEEILHDGIAPNDGVAGLIFKTGADIVEKSVVDVAFERCPLGSKFSGLCAPS